MLFRDVDAVASTLMQERKISAAHKNNVRKQVKQISFCIQQAYEFAKSARNMGATTRSLLAYYSLTALANVEILYKGDGAVALDHRTGNFNAHGLELILHGSLAEFKARMLGPEKGLFGLWRKFANHEKVVTKLHTSHDDGVNTEQLRTWANPTALNTIEPPTQKITLSHCLGSVPLMFDNTSTIGIIPRIARGNISETVRIDKNGYSDRQLELIIHPCLREVFNDVSSRILLKASSVPFASIAEAGGGVRLNVPQGEGGNVVVPEGMTLNDGKTFFLGSGDFLNEFGYYYIGLFICGMITRYHPQMWISELARGSAASTLVDEFVDTALERLPLLTLAQVSNLLILYE